MNYWPNKPPTRPVFRDDCERMNKTQPLNYLGTNLTLTEEDSENLLLCPGDVIGDLNETYVKIGECNVTMYHKDQIIWSKGREDSLRLEGQCESDDYCFCFFYLTIDGDLVLYQDEIMYSYYGDTAWSQKNGRLTEFDQTKTELRLKDHQLQIIWTFDDGSQRLFYLDETHPEFTEDMGEPIKIVDKFMIKNHSDPDKTILRRNEYIGDLNGTYLILQPNCKLQLLNKNKTIWSITAGLEHDVSCTLDIAQDNPIGISRRWMNKRLDGHSIMESEHNSEVIESKITFSDREPIITQTLKNGSELMFFGGRLKKEPTQIAQDATTIPRMGYFGNLTGLHLILEHNCSLILANGDEKLWEFQNGPRDSVNAAIECGVRLEGDSDIFLFNSPHDPKHLLERYSTEYTGDNKLTLENDQIVIKRQRRDQKQPDIFYAGQQTNGTFFQFIAQNSIVISPTSSFAEILPKMGYIGDLDGVYVLLNQNCNLLLYNKTQLLWESATFLDQTSHRWCPCGLGLHEDMQVKISAPIPGTRYDERQTIWSAMDFRPQTTFGKLRKAELSIVNDELLLTYTFQDGTVKTEKAMKGTNHFTNNLAQFQPPPHTDEEKMEFCMERNATHHGANLTSSSNDPQDILLCLGDTFGDLNETYVTHECCSLTVYHKDKRIWSSNTEWVAPWTEDCECMFSLKRDGNLVLDSVVDFDVDPTGTASFPERRWESQTNFNPVKTELTIQDQQVKMIQTFVDGSQRTLYGDANHQEFREYLGKPIQVGDKFILKSHHDEDKTILRRNEYIGDLNGTHLILQTNCDLQLLNKNETIWSFRPPFTHSLNCTLNVAEDNTIELFSLVTGKRESIMKSGANLQVIESRITFEDNQPMIIQTLKSGSELIFCGSGLNHGLNLKRELKQIAKKTLIAPYTLKRKDYIGNLTGLHLVLEQNCSLILANSNNKLWELQREVRYSDGPLMDCSLQFYPSGEMYLEREWTKELQRYPSLLPFYYNSDPSMNGLELTLKNDKIIITRGHSDRGSEIFHAGPQTNGEFFQFIAQSSILIERGDIILPKSGYIGDLNGVYTIFDKTCNWVLYNKTQMIWESGTSLNADESRLCHFYRSGDELWISRADWYALKASDFKKVVRTELLVNNDGLWLIYAFRDGTVNKYKAIMGKNHFGLVSKDYGKSFALEL